MKVSIPYGSDKEEVEVSDKNVAGIVNLNESAKFAPENEVLKKAIENPINSKSFGAFVEAAGDKEILIIVNDATRPPSAAKVIPFIYEQIKGKNFRFIVATGAHRAPSEKEYNHIFGEYYPKIKDRVIVHDSRKKEDMQSIGKFADGSDISINKAAVNADRIVAIGSVEPHYFAGYTGGRKAFLPGIASYDTIRTNHKHALDRRAAALALKGNPVHDGMERAASCVRQEVFSIMLVMTDDFRVYAAAAGNINGSFKEAARRSDELFVVGVKEKADVVVAVAAPPQDKNLYQAQKAMDNGKLALKDGGIIILVAKCEGGTGDEAFLKMMGRHKTPQALVDSITSEYNLGDHKAVKLAEIGTWSNMWSVTSLGCDVMKSAFMRQFNSVQEAVDAAIKEKGKDAKVLFLMSASVTVPRIGR